MLVPVSSNHLELRSVCKSLVASNVRVAEVPMLISNVVIFIPKVFVSSVKRICLQHQKCLSPALEVFISSTMNKFVFYLEVGLETPKKNKNGGIIFLGN